VTTGESFSPEDGDAAGLDVGALSEFLRRAFPEISGTLRLKAAEGGQSNPTYFVRYDNCSMILRTKPVGAVAASAHAIDREFCVLKALQPTAVPVPRPILYHAATDIIGTSFYLMEWVQGRVYHDAALPSVSGQARRSYYDSMARALGTLHGVDWRAVGLSDFGKSTDYFARQLARWSRFWRDLGMGGNEDLDAVMLWIERNLPGEEAVCICHGDFRLANIMFDPTHPQVAAILDWELCTIGHPLADVAFSCLAYHSGPDENGGLLGSDLEACGIPTQCEYLETYYAATGTGLRVETFHMVFALFRAAMGAESIASRAGRGQGMRETSANFGRRMGRAYARRALSLIHGCAEV
jgi:aminoglycoside phosphotransferase (APT) family kinase protein